MGDGGEKEGEIGGIWAENAELSGGGSNFSDVGEPLFGNNLDRRGASTINMSRLARCIACVHDTAGWPIGHPTDRLVSRLAGRMSLSSFGVNLSARTSLSSVTTSYMYDTTYALRRARQLYYRQTLYVITKCRNTRRDIFTVHGKLGTTASPPAFTPPPPP